MPIDRTRPVTKRVWVASWARAWWDGIVRNLNSSGIRETTIAAALVFGVMAAGTFIQSARAQFPIPIPSPSPFPGGGGGPFPNPSPNPGPLPGGRNARGSIQGRVFNTFNVGIYRALVSVRDAERASMPGDNFGRQTYTDRNGQYILSGLPAGRYFVIAQCRDFTPGDKAVQIKGDETIRSFDIHMPDTSSNVLDCQ